MKKVIGSKAYNHLCKHYHLYSFIANILIAISMAGMALLGVLTNTLTYQYLLGWGLVLAAIFGVGKTLDQEIDDMDKVRGHSCGSNDRMAKEQSTSADCDCSKHASGN